MKISSEENLKSIELIEVVNNLILTFNSLNYYIIRYYRLHLCCPLFQLIESDLKLPVCFQLEFI